MSTVPDPDHSAHDETEQEPPIRPGFVWTAQQLELLVDLEDKDLRQ